jgi:glycosyltransferase involved in cell wall biosynthesis
MNILYIEPYYSGSHKKWIDSYKKYSKHKIELLTLPGNKWKWRMHGGAVTLAEKFNGYDKDFDLIVCSDFINLPVFKSLCQKKLSDTPIGMYFHENQLSYPWSPNDKDISLNRDLHYHFINYSSSLAADFNFFNSSYHLNSYLISIKKYLKKMPDFNNFDSISDISKKSDVLYIGCELEKFKLYQKKIINKIPLILWNHRWEFDKNPDTFFNLLYKLKNDNIDFEVAILGEKFKEYPEVFDKAKKILGDQIVQFGFCESFADYAKWLSKADVIPVTSNQDFFGISIIEAVYCKTYPLLPNRLSYPELFKYNKNPEYFYNNEKQLYSKLKNLILKRLKPLDFKLNKYDWNNIYKIYDKRFSDLALKPIRLQ